MAIKKRLHLEGEGTTEDQLDPEEQALFYQAVRDAQPLTANRVPASPPPPPPVAVQRRRQESQARLDLAQGDADPPLEALEDRPYWFREGIQHRVRHQLRTGNVPVEAVLDLHGMRVEGARQELARFLQQALERSYRCVRIIHGKGHRSPQRYGVLRQKVQSWLMRRREVLGFASCTPIDGGTGALYVLLKRI